MTRKHFQLIADALTKFQHDGGHAEVCELMADALAQENPRFDRAKFLTACGVK